MTWGAVAGGAIAAAGSMIGGSMSAPSRPKFNPYNGSSMLGDSTWDKKNKRFNTQLSGTGQEFADLYKGMATQYMGGNAPTNPYKQFAFGTAQNAIPGLFSDSMYASQIDPSVFGRYDAQMGGLAQQAGMLPGMFGQLGSAAAMSPQARMMFGMGMDKMGNDYSSIMNQRLGLLREQAAPFEERAANQFKQNLFNMGQLGTSGGGVLAEGFGRGLNMADMDRQLNAQTFAEQLYGRDQQMGAGLMGEGLQGILAGYGTAGNLWGQGAQTTGVLGDLFGKQFGAGTMFNELGNQRALQRLDQAQSMFGFGANLDKADQAHGAQGIAGALGLNNALQDQARLGLQPAAIRMGAPMAEPQSSPIGAFLGGAGSALMQNPQLFSKPYDYGAWRQGQTWAPTGSMAGSPNINTTVDTSGWKMPVLGG